jgi:hypothetical protein
MYLMYLLYFVIIFGVCPLLYFIVARKRHSSELKPILPFISLTFIASLYEFFGTLTFKWNASYWFVIYDILSFLSISYFFTQVLHKQFSKLLQFFLVIFLIFCLFLLFFFDPKDFLAITSYIDTFTTLFVLFFTIIWFRKLILEAYIENLLQNSTFYFISGFILYYCGTLFLFLLSNYICKIDSTILHSYWVINILLNLVLRTLLLVGLWKARTN